MKSFISIATWMVGLSVLLKLAVFFSATQFETFGRFAIFGNIFFLLLGIFFGLRLHKQKVLSKSSYLEDFKAGMRVAAYYALFMSAFVFLYYNYIDPDYFEIRLAKQLEIARENQMDLEQVKKTGAFFLSPFFQTTISLLGFLLLGSFYSAILAFLMRKMKGFGH